LFKFGDNLATALVSPFLIQTGFDQVDVGVASGTIGLIGTITGSIIGGAVCSTIGLGHSLWLFGVMQALGNVGYVLVAQVGPNRPLMYGAMAVETLTAGMGTGAFGVLLLRLTQKKFSATQYALWSSIFALGRTIAGPIAGVLVDSIGWRNFFLVSIAGATPGLIMLQRFSPLGVRDPEFAVEARPAGPPLGREQLLVRAVVGGAVGLALGGFVAVALGMLRALHSGPGGAVALTPQLESLVFPVSVAQWATSISVVVFGVVCGLGWAALAAGRRGVARPQNPPDADQP
jgi:PAT family beta-lactamase induction signal transducer AmpG